MKIAMIAPPWLSLYPGCYYGIENVVHNLTSTLYERGHEVVLFTVGRSTTPATERYWYHKENQYKHVHRPWYQAVPIISSHILYSLNVIRQAGDFDIIHDHNSFTGAAMMAFADGGLPPVLHTLHEPFTDKSLVQKGLPDNRMLYKELRHARTMYFNGVSRSQLRTVPKKLYDHIVSVVHNGVDIADYIFSEKKKDYFVSVGRIGPDKGQGVAAKVCYDLGEKLKIAGSVGEIATKSRLMRQIADPKNEGVGNPYFHYFKEEIAKYLVPNRIMYLGTVFGEAKMKLLSGAKGFLAPINWEEPFGIAIVDALACGTPVVAYRRGAFPEIIEHGKNGFLADNEAEFKQYMQRVGEIDPAYCRESVAKNFSADKMTDEYLERYKEVIERHKAEYGR
jgi:glycosyltransferase involved in cell wall biosynthesis